MNDSQMRELGNFLHENPAWDNLIDRVALKNFTAFRRAETFEEQQIIAAKQNILEDIVREINVIYTANLDLKK